MGEAKRRRDLANAPVQYRDAVTNELRTARNAGDPIAFIAAIKAMGEAELRVLPCHRSPTA
jgi:hypothetical protein